MSHKVAHAVPLFSFHYSLLSLCSFYHIYPMSFSHFAFTLNKCIVKKKSVVVGRRLNSISSRREFAIMGYRLTPDSLPST